jgi:hypothetical protein
MLGKPRRHIEMTSEHSMGRRILYVLLLALGIYLIVRAVAEPFVIDFSDPLSYQGDWGGPSLIGVLAVHTVPGVIAAALLVRAFLRRRGQTDT